MFTTITAALALMISPGHSQPTLGCPADDPRTRAVAERFLTRRSYAAYRDTLVLAESTKTDLRPLVSGVDDAACQRLLEKFGPPAGPDWIWSGYRLGGYYIIAYRRVLAPGRLRLGWSPLYILDLNFNGVSAFMM
ncbi:MAG TPA: hypothetical protein VF613_20040 [Longimicrobium sp.]|jgi:hypothetical protein